MGNISILSREKLDFVEAQLLKRKLKNGNWICVSVQGQLLILSDDVVKQFASPESFDDDSFKELVDNGILVKKNNQGDADISQFVEPQNKLFKFFSYLINICGVVSLMICLFVLLNKGLPFVSAVHFLFENPLKFFLIGLPISALTTAFHEFMHMIFSGNSRSFNLNMRKAVANVPMSHVWTWSRFGRLTAITAGMSLDLIFLLSFLIISNGFFLVASIGSSVLITRLLWQFIITKKTDIYLLISFVADNPVYFEDLTNKVLLTYKVISLSSVILMVLSWAQPIINNFVQSK